MTQTLREELTQALRALVHKVCCKPEGLWGKVRMVKSLWVSAPTPEIMVKHGGWSTHTRTLLFLPEGLIQETESTIRELTEFQMLCQSLRRIDQLGDIAPEMLDSHALSMLATCVEINLNRELRASATDAYGNVHLLQTGFKLSILDHCGEQIDELMQVAAAPVICTLYAPLHGFHIEDFGVHVDFAEDLSVVLEGEVPLRVLIAELRGRDSFYVRNRASHYLRVMFHPTNRDRNNRACFPEAAAALAAFLAALRLEFRGWVASANVTIDFNLPWLPPRYYVIDQNVPIGGLYSFHNVAETRKNVANRFRVLRERLPSLAKDPTDSEPFQYLLWALRQMDATARATHETARASAILMSFDGLFGVENHGSEKWIQHAKTLIHRDCWIRRQLTKYLSDAYEVRNALFHEGRPPNERDRSVLLPLLEDLSAIAVRWILDSSYIEIFKTKSAFLDQLIRQRPNCYCPRPPGKLPTGLAWGTRTLE
jgi:hypothetical protein